MVMKIEPSKVRKRTDWKRLDFLEGFAVMDREALPDLR
jgi:hypothetical protein